MRAAIGHSDYDMLQRYVRLATERDLGPRAEWLELGWLPAAEPARRRLRAICAVVRCRRSGSPNKGPPKNRDEALTGSVTVHAAGIRSLYISFKGEIGASRLDAIEVLKVRAQETGQPQTDGPGARTQGANPAIRVGQLPILGPLR